MKTFESESLIKNASLLRLNAIDIADGIKNGNFQSLYRGQGIEFCGVRDYIRGDDIRSIDWNVTARMGKPFVKMFEEERDLQIFLIIDTSLSMQIGTKKSKYFQAAYTAAILTFAAELNNSPLGAVFFDNSIKFSCSPQFGKEHTMFVISMLEKFLKGGEKGSVLALALNGAGKLLKKRSLVFVLSDFKTSNWEKPLILLSQKNDIIAINIKDNLDQELPALGSVPFEDLESGITMTLPTSSQKFKKKWKEFDDNQTKHFTNICLRHGIFPVLMNTNDEPLEILNSIFARKKIKR